MSFFSTIMPFSAWKNMSSDQHSTEASEIENPQKPVNAGIPDGEHEPALSGKIRDILATIEETARLGHVPGDALIGRLYTLRCDEIGRDRQRLATLEQELEQRLARLGARFPVPQPEPEKEKPVRIRRFGPISRDLRRGGSFRPDARP